MNRYLIFLMIFLLTACGEDKWENAVLYLSNHSTDDFQKSYFKIYINNKEVFSDTVQNERVSFHWTERDVSVPKRKFAFKAIVSGENYRLERDTIIQYNDSLKIFVKFNFSPFYKRYMNPEIYKYIKGEVNEIKSIADSLYDNNLLSNASEYLNDTIPNESCLEIFIK